MIINSLAALLAQQIVLVNGKSFNNFIYIINLLLDDGWMNITEKDLAVMMERKMTCDSSKSTPEPEAQAPLVDTSADLQSMVFGVNSFIDKVSSHTGAEFPW